MYIKNETTPVVINVHVIFIQRTCLFVHHTTRGNTNRGTLVVRMCPYNVYTRNGNVKQTTETGKYVSKKYKFN